MAVQHPAGHAVGDELDRTNFFGGALVHHFDHLPGQFGLLFDQRW
jgi:hypothetical protein